MMAKAKQYAKKMSFEQVLDLRSMIGGGASYHEIIKKYKLEPHIITRLLNVSEWKNQKLPPVPKFIIPDDPTSGDGVIYKEIDGFPDYKIGDNGKLYSRMNSAKRKNQRPWRRVFGRSANKGRNKDIAGYILVTLWNRTAKVNRRTTIHCLVLESFVGKRPDGYVCRHIDDDATNNNLTNLVWGTQQENVNDSIKNNRIVRGSERKQSRLSEQQVREIRSKYASRGISLKKLADEYGVCTDIIHGIVRGIRWVHVK